MLRHWREKEFSLRLASKGQRQGLAAWRLLNRWPRVYRLAMRLAAAVLRSRSMAGTDERRWIHRLPFLGAAWTQCRDMPAPAGETFQARWRRSRK